MTTRQGKKPRRRFSEHEVIETLYHQGVVILCHRCQLPIRPMLRESENIAFDIEREHIHELALGGKDEPENCAYSHANCHAAVTFGNRATTAGSSVGKIAKERRIIRTQKFAVVKEIGGGELDASRSGEKWVASDPAPATAPEWPYYEPAKYYPPKPKRPFPKGRKMQSRKFGKRAKP
jgi:hypothetical protein